MPAKPNPVQAANPFAMSSSAAQANPFQAQTAPRPSINELRNQQNFGVLGQQQQAVPMMVAPQAPPVVMQPVQSAGPWGPAPSGQSAASPTFNPFLA